MTLYDKSAKLHLWTSSEVKESRYHLPLQGMQRCKDIMLSLVERQPRFNFKNAKAIGFSCSAPLFSQLLEVNSGLNAKKDQSIHY